MRVHTDIRSGEEPSSAAGLTLEDKALVNT